MQSPRLAAALLALHAAYILLLGPSAASGTGRIVGGAAVSGGEYPFVVHLFVDSRPHCGGVLVGAEWVVTAAHCVTTSDPQKTGPGSFRARDPAALKVGYGPVGGSLARYAGVESVVVHPAFNPDRLTTDLAVLRVKVAGDMWRHTEPIHITAADIAAGAPVVVVGWGQTAVNNSRQASRLTSATLEVADDAACRSGASDWDGQNGRYVCTSTATNPGTSTCFGDSGSPLVLSNGGSCALLALVSFEVNADNSALCAQPGSITYYTRVSTYLDFLSSATGISPAVLVGKAKPWVQASVDNAVGAESSAARMLSTAWTATTVALVAATVHAFL